MASCQIKLKNLPVKSVSASGIRTTRVLTTDLGPMMAQDVSDAIVQVFNCELQEQEQLGNEPTLIRINNRERRMRIRTGGTPGGVLVFKAQAFFPNAAEMIAALREAYQELIAVTRRRSGRAQGAYMIYLGQSGADHPGKFIGMNLSGINALEGQVGPDSMISIIGPNVIYGRRLYWNPKGDKKITKRFPGTRAARKAAGVQILGGYLGTATMHKDVKKKMRGRVRWKAFAITDPFYAFDKSAMVGDRRAPAISITLKRQRRRA